MAHRVILPRVDMDMATGRIGAWLARDGDTVRAGDPLFEIETDKATMEIEAPGDGVLRILTEAGERDIGVGSVVGYVLAPDEMLPETVGMPAPVAEVRATPLARRLARDRGIALEEIAGSGPRGRVVGGDVPAAPAIRAGSKTLNVLHGGGGDGVPVVFLHGFAGESASWRPLWRHLGAVRPLHGIDLPGHGGSAPGGTPEIAEIADAVRATMREIAPGPVHLVGHSLGGGIAGRIAAEGGIELRSLLLIAPAGLGPEIDAGFIAGVLRARSEASLRPWLERLFADRSWVTPALLRAVLDVIADAGRVEFWRALADACIPDGTQSAEFGLDPAALAVPVR
ncbi:MAG TPA: alpha/beta fold hydrolase, partial [Acidiphilium sp.]